MEAVITMDKSGRITLPASIRKRFKTNRFEFRVTKDKIELKPLESLDSMFGALPELDLEKIMREHEEEMNTFSILVDSFAGRRLQEAGSGCEADGCGKACCFGGKREKVFALWGDCADAGELLRGVRK